ncbi:UNVERIFIED_CONTAM: hypothetical protein Sradi_6748100 [Sesamum radiatum]|uniref:Uncharacterized protein n=1 Tax=Sesamum radiatum TaxID=300843 RepID=A0AAW2JQQ5_SESRA
MEEIQRRKLISKPFSDHCKEETSRAKNPTTTDGEELNAPDGCGGGAGDGDGAMFWWSWPS